MNNNPLLQLPALGQSLWMDFIRRGTISSGELQRLIDEDQVRGVTSNPSIFEKAIAGSQDYDESIRALSLEGKNREEIYQAVTVEDIRGAADLFRPVYDELEGRDGFVSLEVSPLLAHDAAGTIEEARRLWAAVNRPNVMIKVPATREGLEPIQRLTGEGINVNVTLLFGLPRYEEVAEAYISGLEERSARGEPVGKIASVASFFLSRIDVLVDPKLEEIISSPPGTSRARLARTLHGQTAIACAKTAYQIYQKIFQGERFQKLALQGAKPQRLLWASTSTKNPAYSDVMYVEALIGRETINTLPLETIHAYRDHGRPAPRLEEGASGCPKVLDGLSRLGIDLAAAVRQLEDEGVEKFIKAFRVLMESLEKKRASALEEPVDRQVLEWGSYEREIRKELLTLDQEQFGSRLWRKDPSLWKKDPRSQETIRNGLGWLHVAEKMEEHIEQLSSFAGEVRQAGFRRVLDMGMGGSTLAPLALQRIFAPGPKGLPFQVLDTTDPETILRIEREGPLEETLFIVASKSGTTAEPLAFGEYFYSRLKEKTGDRAGENFVAITDPETPLAELARKRSFRRTFLNYKDIGGRYSALSYFGLLPAALMDLEVSELLIRSLRMRHACDSCVPLEENPGLLLGATLGVLAQKGRNKLTFLIPKTISSFGLWLEQLLAESTGKEGRGVLPVAGEPLRESSMYGDDRIFAYFRLGGEGDSDLERAADELQKAGHPLLTIRMEDRLDLAQEFFRWEFATAVAGAVLGINAFDQPNVQESKDNTNRLLDLARSGKDLPEPSPGLTEGPLGYYGGAGRDGAEFLKNFFSRGRPGDYIALQAYLPEIPAVASRLQNIRNLLGEKLRLATTLGYGPRFLHSTGQFHKGGPNTGLFVQLTGEEIEDARLPNEPFTFGIFKRAQALGDWEALKKHGRRLIRVHLGADLPGGLDALTQAVRAAW